jgi:hypothetical protein
MSHQPHSDSVLEDVAVGAFAGCLATIPMTISMAAMYKILPATERYPLPPRQITMKFAEQVGIQDRLNEEERYKLTLTAHFGAGAVAGALYGFVAPQIHLPAPIAGASFGLMFWAGNYLGVLPALGLLNSATQHPLRRTGLMIAAHLVWGSITGLLAGQYRAIK